MTDFRLGAWKASVPELINFYNPAIRSKAFLGEYIKHFNALELQATHNKFPDEAQVAKWLKVVEGTDFKFCPKMNIEITHRGLLSYRTNIANKFIEVVGQLGYHLGPILVQLPNTYNSKKKDDLLTFLDAVPAEKLFIEVRDESWFPEEEIFSLAEELRNRNVGIVITDTAGRRDAVHMYLTKPIAFVRFSATGNIDIDIKRLKDWAIRLNSWSSKGLEEVYYFIHADGAYLRDMMETAKRIFLDPYFTSYN